MAEPNKTISTNEALQQRILEIQLRQLEEQEAVKADKIAQDNAVRTATASALKQKMAREKEEQRLCTHRKENGQTRIGGVRASTGHGVLLSCQRCGREYTEKDCPSDLAPKAEHIGGPILGLSN